MKRPVIDKEYDHRHWSCHEWLAWCRTMERYADHLESLLERGDLTSPYMKGTRVDIDLLSNDHKEESDE